MEQQLDNLLFYNCSYLNVICGDFAKRPALGIARCKSQNQANGLNQTYIFQLYKWYGIKVIKCYLAKRYKEIQEKIINLI